jgi:hypothetical protein
VVDVGNHRHVADVSPLVHDDTDLVHRKIDHCIVLQRDENHEEAEVDDAQTKMHESTWRYERSYNLTDTANPPKTGLNTRHTYEY